MKRNGIQASSMRFVDEYGTGHSASLQNHVAGQGDVSPSFYARCSGWQHLSYAARTVTETNAAGGPARHVEHRASGGGFRLGVWHSHLG